MGWDVFDIDEQGGRVVIVTGANSGIGLETARCLAAKGAHVVLACRSEERGRAAIEKLSSETPGASVELRLLDLSDLGSVRSFADAFGSDHERLDLLINNAGVMMPPFSRNDAGFEMQFATNHLGHFALSGLLLPMVEASGAGRVVTVSSQAHRTGRLDFDNLDGSQGYAKAAAYGRSKLANLLFTYELQRRLSAAGRCTLAVAAHPGWTATELQKHTPLFRTFNPLLAQGPVAGALPTLYAAAAKDVRGGEYFGPSGIFELRGSPHKVSSSVRSHDREVAARLWQLSEEATGVSFDLSVS